MTISAGDNGKASQDAGFTLVELLVVLAILGLVAGLAATTVPASRQQQASDLDLRLHGLRMAAGLKAARAAAINRGHDVAFAFNARENTWSINGIEAPTRLPLGFHLKLETARVALREDGEGRLVFFPDGSATGGRVTLIRDTQHLTIAVGWLNGAVSIGERTP